MREMTAINWIKSPKFLNLYLPLVWLIGISWTAGASQRSPNEVSFLLVAKDIPWWKNPADATVDEHREMEKCQVEHEAYKQALSHFGFPVYIFQNSHAESASMFVEDPAVVIGYRNGRYHVVINRVGSDWRVNEGDAVKSYLQGHNHLTTSGVKFIIHDMRRILDATLDGGDVLRIEDQLFIGLSPHTNRSGAEYLAEIADGFGLKPHILDVPKGLHLKSSVSLAGEKLIVYDPELASSELLKRFRQTLVDYRLLPVEHLGSNVLYLGKSPKTGRDTVVVAGTAPETVRILRQEFGLDVIVLSRPCHESLGGRMTCSSLRFPVAVHGSWAT